jgi:hypothetical protein
MAGVRRLLLSALAALALASTAAAAANPEQLRLQKTLKAAMVKAFQKQAPKLKLTTVSCRLPKSGTVARCTAHFKVSAVKGYYPVKVVLHETGTISWTASSPKCFDAKSGKKLPC